MRVDTGLQRAGQATVDSWDSGYKRLQLKHGLDAVWCYIFGVRSS